MATKNPKSPILNAIREAARDEALAVAFFERHRWGTSPACPHCGSVAVYAMQGRDGARERNFRWRCRDCGKMYSVRTGTVLEESRLPVCVWLHAFWRASASKKGVSALQIARECEITHKSALFLMHRIREAMRDDGGSKLTGIVESDETFIGGKRRRANRHEGESGPLVKASGRKRVGRGSEKAPVLAMVERGGRVRARHITAVTAKNLQGAVHEWVDSDARVMTDQEAGYHGLWRTFGDRHQSVNHSEFEYARGDVHTNTIEGFFSLLKRGVYGTFHSVSKHHLHRYLDEFSFRYNTRELDDGERTVEAIKGAEGKRLVYRQPAPATA
jgi:transposase-like protein